jgi:hypothetical protein
MADAFFSGELEATHDRAFRAGVAHALAKIKFDLDTKVISLELGKTEMTGWQRACDQIDKTRSILTYTTGARL